MKTLCFNTLRLFTTEVYFRDLQASNVNHDLLRRAWKGWVDNASKFCSKVNVFTDLDILQSLNWEHKISLKRPAPLRMLSPMGEGNVNYYQMPLWHGLLLLLDFSCRIHQRNLVYLMHHLTLSSSVVIWSEEKLKLWFTDRHNIVLKYSKTSLIDHLPRSTTPLYRSLYFGPKLSPTEIF